MQSKQLHRSVTLAALLCSAGLASAQIATVPTTDPAALAAALKPSGLTITSITIRSGVPGQIGTYSNFNLPPATIRDGIVLSSGDVTSIGPLPEVLDPAYDPASPPAAVNTQMVMDGSDGSTPEFNAYGLTPGTIENFSGSFDVAAVEVHFTIPADAQVQFDFIFGSVEFPVYTSSYTDAFLVFLDGTAPTDQICFDAAGVPVQVGRSFAGLEITGDQNTAFASPHALIHHLTTTTAVLPAGEHTLIFEVGDVNDHILDSAVFITGLRTGVGIVGTEPSEDPPQCHSLADIAGGGANGRHSDGVVDGNDFIAFINSFAIGDPDIDDLADVAGGGSTGLRPDGNIDGADFVAFINAFAIGC